MSATLQTVSSTREEYIAVIEGLKATTAPETKKGAKMSKLETFHINLIATLESRVEAIDTELVVSSFLFLLFVVLGRNTPNCDPISFEMI